MDTLSGNTRAYVAQLMDCYGKVLTEKQYAAMDLYFQEDLTLSEISEQTGITRQGVWDNIRRGVKQLTEMEEKLGHMAKFNEIRRDAEQGFNYADAVRDYAKRKFFPTELIRKLDVICSTFEKSLD